MFAEPDTPHHEPHFHASYQQEEAVFGIDPVELLSGSLPRRQQRLVEAWAELHRDELLGAWRELKAGRLPLSIAPLK